MTCHDTLNCLHEPFADAWYFGSERLSDRYDGDEKTRTERQGAIGAADVTYKAVIDDIERKAAQVGPLSFFPCRDAVFLTTA